LGSGENYLGNLTLYRKELIDAIGGFREDLEAEYVWDLALRITETISPSHIYHIPFVLFHNFDRCDSAISNPDKNNDIKCAVIRSHFERTHQKVEISTQKNNSIRVKHVLPDPNPKVTIIIPTRNRLGLLRNCLNSILKKTIYSNYEIAIINNQSNDPEIISYFRSIQDVDKVSVIDYKHRFNYSAINNYAVKQTKGDVLVFLNNDIEVISPDWLHEMVSHAVRKNIGAVGALLYYRNNTIQHAGIILGMGGVAGHAYLNKNKEELEKIPGALAVRNYSAVTGACMAIARNKFLEVGGFNKKHLPIAFNDIDLCLRLLNKGYRNLWTPYAELYHLESASRGFEDTSIKKVRFHFEEDYMRRIWNQTLLRDNAFNPNLSLVKHDYSLSFPPRIEKPWKG